MRLGLSWAFLGSAGLSWALLGLSWGFPGLSGGLLHLPLLFPCVFLLFSSYGVGSLEEGGVASLGFS